jgi:hypothetical protein
MFGVRIIVFACTLLGVAVSLPLDLAEAKPHSSRGSYSQYLRKSYAQHHARKSYAKHHSRKSYAKHGARKSYAKHGARKSYTRHASQKPSVHSSRKSAQIQVKGSTGLGARPARWCGWWMRSQKGGGPELNLARNWAHWGNPSGPKVGAVVVWSHHVGMITGRTANGQWIVKSGNDGGRVRERPRSVAGAVFRTGTSA